ncbi:MAG: sensor histidine kinase [Bacillota bacterium]|nr:sensor histidine kinase [Bacillota bacterium]
MKSFINFVRNLSVSWKFVSAYFAILAIPLILTGFYIYYQNSNSTVDQARLIMEQNLLQTKASIVQKGKVIENLSQVLSNDKSFKDFMSSYYENYIYKVYDYQFDFSPIVKTILSQNNAFYSIRIYMRNVIISQRMNNYYSIRFWESPQLYFKAAQTEPKTSGWKSIHDSTYNMLDSNSSSPEQVFSYSEVIYKSGALEAEVKEDALFDMLRDPVISKLGRVFIVDSSNRIVSRNIPELFKKDISSIGITDFVTSKRISKSIKINGEKSILINLPIDEINCSIIGLFPVKNFNNEINNSLKNTIILLIISSIILGVIIYFTTGALLGRIKKMVKAMKQVNDNNLAVSVPVKAMDEFGELALTFNNMTSRIHELVEMVYKSRLLEREAELKAWEMQINPHFLYNTLATISWVARKDNSKDVVKMSNSLAKFYRLVLSKGNSLIYVSEELEMVRSFLQIQKIRFEDRFDAEYLIDESVNNCKIIKNILQPLVENALNHGIEPKRSHGTILIKAWLHVNKLYFQIIDDGVGINSSVMKEILSGRVESSSGSGYAIKNILERLKAYYGTEFSFDIYSKPGIGTVITITINSEYR